MTNEQLPDSALKRATNLVRDAKQAVIVGLIPILGLIFILRLVQWYLFRKQYPAFVSGQSEHIELAKEFRSALPHLWFAVLFWPALILFIIIYSSLT